ncbi:PfkB family carbohydrate kinase [Actinomadura rudentiformis]|uniref:PfkB family carbohydrate kinase n=1 Tax=Actinomadura rudentiformis TaxID=359158 RepID=UPI001CEF7BF5|nr:PfkB family carbohydrate kinase [Actinomadura rudentiformis]
MNDGPEQVVVVGQIARDLVVVVDEVPGAHQAVPVRRRREMLGGKGANQAVGLAQLGVPVALVAVAGDDTVAGALLDQARRDGVDVSGVVRRSGEPTGLIIDIVDGGGDWRYLEDLPKRCSSPRMTCVPQGTYWAGLASGAGVFGAARLASATAAATVGHPGGRPSLSPAVLDRYLPLVDESLD